ncbi:DMT family transporter [Sphingomonas pokkalii]|uniref:EamA family transporter n=1 Tax=Sphingomonas pokkalii TaxID=2175090 RepID=A0A2U0SA38_9SPHN|nr:DMT family transporter [Sphingomonas pokkalii]PVX28238.1 EamA family transporter [Sphingomonas pokkalii]
MHRNAPTTKTSPARSHVATALVAALIANAALATGPLFVRMADVGPVSAAFWRLIIATPILFAAATAMGEKPIAAGRGRWWILAIAGVVFALDLASWHVGIVRTTLANSTLFGNSASLIFPIYGFVVARAWPSKTQGAALLLAGIGGALLLGRSAELSSQHLAGDLFCLLAGVFYAVYFALMARVRATIAPVPALALSSLATIPPLLVIALAMGEQIVPHLWWPLLALAIVSQLIGQGCMIYALGHLSPLVIGIALLVQPAVGAALGWVIFDEKLAAADLFGAALVAAALVLVRQGAVRPKG